MDYRKNYNNTLKKFGKPLIEFIAATPLETCRQLLEIGVTHQVKRKNTLLANQEIMFTVLNRNKYYFYMKINKTFSLEGVLDYIDEGKTEVQLNKGRNSILIKVILLGVPGGMGTCSLLAYFGSNEIGAGVFAIFFYLMGIYGYFAHTRWFRKMLIEAIKYTLKG